MKKFYYPLILFAIVFCNSHFLQAQKGESNDRSILSKQEVDDAVRQTIIETGQVYDWSSATSQQLYSALVHSDSIAFVGYKPADLKSVSVEDFRQKLNTERWESPRQKVLTTIEEWDQKGQHKDGREIRSVLFERFPELPFMAVRLFDLELIERLREMPECRFIDVGSFTLGSAFEFQDGIGCGGIPTPMAEILTGTYSEVIEGITQNYTTGWHHATNSITDAWSYGLNNGMSGAKGQGVKVVLLDTGYDQNHPQLQPGVWQSQGSAGRQALQCTGMHLDASDLDDMLDELAANANTAAVQGDIDVWISQQAFDGEDDTCGHGTALAGIIGGPLTSDGYVCGTAPLVDLEVYRVTNDVVFNAWEEKLGVITGFLKAASDPQVKIISMSLGNVATSPLIEDAIQMAVGAGKLPFCANGTTKVLEGFGLEWSLLANNNISAFPASMRETVAVTGMLAPPNTQSELCTDCLGSEKVDFAFYMETPGDPDNLYSPGYAFYDANNTTNLAMRPFAGSSSATGNTAAVAALLWSVDPQASPGTILNAMHAGAQIPSGSDKMDKLGRGNINLLTALNHLPNRTYEDNGDKLEATLRVTNIEFPEYDDGWDPNKFVEWAIELHGNKHYAKVKAENGERSGIQLRKGSPLSFMKDNEDGSKGPLIEFSVGTFDAGTSPIREFPYQIHEDDSKGFTVDLSGNRKDDLHTASVFFVPLSLSTHSFEITLSNNDKVKFWYELDYKIVTSSEPSLDIDTECEQSENTFIEAFPAGLESYTFSVNGFEEAPSPVNTISLPWLLDGDVVTVEICDNGSCNTASSTVVTYPLPVISANPDPNNPLEYNFEILSPFPCYDAYTFQWHYGDGTYSEFLSIWDIESHLYGSPGQQTVELQIYGSDGYEVDVISVDINVSSTGNDCSLFEDEYSLSGLFEVTKTTTPNYATITPEEDEDFENILYTYDWGDEGSQNNIVTFMGPQTRSHYYQENGTYTITITMNDLSTSCYSQTTKVIKFNSWNIASWSGDFVYVDIAGIAPISPIFSAPDRFAGTIDDSIFDFDNPTPAGEFTNSGTTRGEVGLIGGKPLNDEQLGNKIGENPLELIRILAVPNPATNGETTVVSKSDHDIVSLQVYAADGRLLRAHNDINQQSFNLENLPEGIVLVKAVVKSTDDEKLMMQTIRLIVTR